VTVDNDLHKLARIPFSLHLHDVGSGTGTTTASALLRRTLPSDTANYKTVSFTPDLVARPRLPSHEIA
jgi:hypothetical protein